MTSPPDAPIAGRTPRRGTTLLEVLMALAVLATVTTAVVTGLFNLHHTQQIEHETAVAERTAQLIAERIMGGTWSTLGQVGQSWSWHRRETPRALRTDLQPLTPNPPDAFIDAPNRSPRHPPMTEGAADPRHDLVALGLVTGPSGVAELRAFVEYYRMDALTLGGGTLILRGGGADADAALIYPRRPPTAAEAGIDFGLPEAADPDETDHLDLGRDAASGAQSNDAVLVRILITWRSSGGGTRRHELLLARKQ